MKKINLLTLLSFISFLGIAQSTIYSESFTGQNGKGVVGGTSLVFDTSGVSWSIIADAAGLTASSDYFEVVNEVFEAQDVDNEQIWLSDTIDISNYTNVAISADVSEVGTMESTDYFDFSYSLDGGSNWNKITNYNGLGSTSRTLIDDFTAANVSIGSLSGTSLIIEFRIVNNSGSEKTRFDNVLVTGSLAGSFNAQISATTDVSCNGNSDGSATVSVSNGTANYTYSWSNGATTVATPSTTDAVINLAAGTYTVTVTDGNGTTATAITTISEPSAINLNVNVNNNVSCNGLADGALMASVSGGIAPYSHFWMNGSSSQTISGLTAGTYGVTISDANGCITNGSGIVTQPNAITLTLNNSKANSCSPANDGELTVGANGGTGALTFNWSNGITMAPSASIASQSFENSLNDNWNYTLSPAAYNTSGDIWDTIQSFSGISANDGAVFLGMQDLNNANGGGNFYHTLTFDPVDVSTLGASNLSFDYYTVGFDSPDEIEYEVVLDNDTVWSTNGIALNKNTGSWTTVSVAIPAATNFVRLRIQAKQDGGSDRAAIDNLFIQENGALVSATLPGLAAGSYGVTVSDENGCSTTNSYTVSQDTACALPPTNLRERNIQPTSALVLWDQVFGADLYKITARPSSSSNWTIVEFKNTQVTRRELNGLTAGTKYFWTVNARVNGVWTGQAQLASFTTPLTACVNPTSLNVTNVNSTAAQLNWNTQAGVSQYRIRYRALGSTNWILKATPGNRGSQFIKGLTPGTTYEWKLRSKCGSRKGNGWINGTNFTTSVAAPMQSARVKYNDEEKVNTIANVSVYPNPSSGVFKLNFDQETENLQLAIFDLSGKLVFEQQFVGANYQYELNTSQLNNGVYFLQLSNSEGMSVQRIVIQK